MEDAPTDPSRRLEMTGPAHDFVDRAATSERVRRLRAECARLGVHGFLIPRNDEHFGEWVTAASTCS